MAYTNVATVAGMFPAFQRPVAWTPNAALVGGTLLKDANGNTQKSSATGVTGPTQPAWNTAIGGTTTDNTITWTNQGPTTQKPPDTLIQQYIDDVAGMVSAALQRRFGEAIGASTSYGAWLVSLLLPNKSWLPSTAFSLNDIVADDNQPLAAQQVTVAGTSGAVKPFFSPAYGGTTADGTATWKNAGQSDQLRVLERGNRYGAAHQLGMTLASFGVAGMRDLAKHYGDSDWQPFIRELNAETKDGKARMFGAFDFLFDPQSNVASPRPGLLAKAGGDQPVNQAAAQGQVGAFFSKWGTDFGRGGAPLNPYDPLG